LRVWVVCPLYLAHFVLAQRRAADEASGSDSDSGSGSGGDGAEKPQRGGKPKALSKKEQRRLAKGAKSGGAAPAAAAADAPAEPEPEIKVTVQPLERKPQRKTKAPAFTLDDLVQPMSQMATQADGGDDGWSDAKKK